ncbi:MAG: hypothetical protein ACTSRL_14340, partial [Candidatus Helarchaeota archaeon]
MPLHLPLNVTISKCAAASQGVKGSVPFPKKGGESRSVDTTLNPSVIIDHINLRGSPLNRGRKSANGGTGGRPFPRNTYLRIQPIRSLLYKDRDLTRSIYILVSKSIIQSIS